MYMKKIHISLIAYHKLWNRLAGLITSDTLSQLSFSIYSEEPHLMVASHLPVSPEKFWNKYIALIGQYMINNIYLLNGLSRSEILSKPPGQISNYPWLSYRALTTGEKSVVHKHTSSYIDSL